MKSDPKNIAEIFSPQLQYIIPIFQRHYVWSRDDQWEPLWEDLLSQLRIRLDGRTPKPHYCGAIVIEEKIKDNISDISRFNVIDGQQRLTTFQIILAALRDVCIKKAVNRSFERIGKLVFNVTQYENEADIQSHIKLRPTKYDRLSFMDVLTFTDRERLRQKYYTVYQAKTSRKSIEKVVNLPNSVSCYLFFYDSITKLISNPELFFGIETYSADVLLDSVCKVLLADFLTVVILLDQTDDAQVIFESLNYRGQPLLASDLIRNYAFMRAEQNHENLENIYETAWAPFEDRFWTFEERQGRLKKQRIEFFFVNFLVANKGSEVNQSRVYQEYLEWISEHRHEMTVKKEIEFVAKFADVYRTLIQPLETSSLTGVVRFLSAFDISIAYPLIMKVFTDDHIEETDKEQILSDFESYIIRRTICERTAKSYNKVIIQAIKELKIKNLSAQVFRQFLLSSNAESVDWPNDEEFNAAFIRKPVYKNLSSSRLAFILQRLENAERSKFSEDIKINSELSIEHIIPQSYAGVWPLRDGTNVNTEQIEHAKRLSTLGLPLDPKSKLIVERESLINTIGNLTLIIGKLNSSIGNGTFESKRASILQHSALRLNRYFHQHFEWTESTILERANNLFTDARKIWPRP